MNQKTIAFFRAFLRKVLKGKIQVESFGWWPAGFKGTYSLSLTWTEE